MQNDILNAAWEASRSVRVLAEEQSKQAQDLEYGELFAAFDSDGSGIDWDEWKCLVETVGVPSQVVDGLFEETRVKGEEPLTRENFITLCRKLFPHEKMTEPNRLHLKTRLDLLRLFRFHDTNNTGYIEWTDFVVLVRGVSGIDQGVTLSQTQSNRLWQAFQKMDKNNDNKLSFSEFCDSLWLAAAALQEPDQQEQPQVASQVVRVVRPMPIPMAVPVPAVPMMPPPMMPHHGFLPLFPPPGYGFIGPVFRGSPFSSANLLHAHRLRLMHSRF